MTPTEIAAFVERLDSHMGRAEVPDLLRDCRLARDVISRLRTERDAAMRLLRPFADAVGDLHEHATDEDNLWESPAAMSLTAGDLRRTLEFLGLMGTDVPPPEVDPIQAAIDADNGGRP